MNDRYFIVAPEDVADWNSSDPKRIVLRLRRENADVLYDAHSVIAANTTFSGDDEAFDKLCFDILHDAKIGAYLKLNPQRSVLHALIEMRIDTAGGNHLEEKITIETTAAVEAILKEFLHRGAAGLNDSYRKYYLETFAEYQAGKTT